MDRHHEVSACHFLPQKRGGQVGGIERAELGGIGCAARSSTTVSTSTTSIELISARMVPRRSWVPVA